MALTARSGWVRGAYAKVDAGYEAFLQAGFPTAEFAGQPEGERLHCRNEYDRTNWLGLLAKCNEVQQLSVELETPELMDQLGLRFRCVSGRQYAVSYTDGKARLLVLLQQVEDAEFAWFGLKDQVRDAESRRELAAIDIEGAWA